MRINIGCGAVAHQDWLNLDLAPQHPLAVACDLRRGLPVADASCDATYSSHVLEHLEAAEADGFVAEQFRVLRPGGVIRVVVPDLETICRRYLDHLEALRRGDDSRRFAYRFTLLELFDQVVRDRTGGALIDAYREARIPADREYILSRHGAEARPHLPGTSAAGMPPRPRIRQSLRQRIARGRDRLALRLIGWVGGAAAAEALQIGWFRRSGEVHRTMYDSWSLSVELQRHGFADVRVVSAQDSRIPDFARFGLDAQDGVVRKPDSIFVEAVKPVP